MGKGIKEETFGQRVMRLRKERGFSRAELASRADIHYGTLYKFETEERSNPSMEFVRSLVFALGVSYARLIDGE